MKIGILGSGIVGQTLTIGFLNEGHEVMIGSRTPGKEEVIKFKGENPAVLAGTFGETAAFGEVIVLATGGTVTAEAVRMAGFEHFTGKTVIDATNPIAKAPPENGVLRFFTSLDESLMEQTQKLIPEANLVKAFSCVGNPFMYKPDFPGGPPTMFICGNNDAAKKTVTEILLSFGWEIEDMGKVEAARAIEPLCILWCIPGMIRNEWNHAFKIIKALK
jgi:predicted dinucleotide-binding enzyme